MRQLTLKELQIALKVLQQMDTDVPEQLYVTISDQIRKTETRIHERRISRMTEEELIHLDQRAPHKLRITTREGRIIQNRRNSETYLSALRLIEPDRLAGIDFSVRHHPLIIQNTDRKRITGYERLSPGLFAYVNYTPRERAQALHFINTQLELNWEVEMI